MIKCWCIFGSPIEFGIKFHIDYESSDSIHGAIGDDLLWSAFYDSNKVHHNNELGEGWIDAGVLQNLQDDLAIFMSSYQEYINSSAILFHNGKVMTSRIPNN